MATSENLQNAFAGESQANRKYLAFAKKAEQDGFPQIARLFRAAAAAETIHAHSHLRVMGGIGSTAENVKAAQDGEGFEFQEMYPDYLNEAESEGNNAAAASFKRAMAAEEVHYNLYGEALAAVKKGKDLASQKVYVCSVCGHIEYGQAPDECPLCGAKKEKFTEVE